MGEILGFLYKKIYQLNWQPLAPPIEGLYVEVKLKNQNWLIGCSYNLDKSMISQHMEAAVKWSCIPQLMRTLTSQGILMQA